MIGDGSRKPRALEVSDDARWCCEQETSQSIECASISGSETYRAEGCYLIIWRFAGQSGCPIPALLDGEQHCQNFIDIAKYSSEGPKDEICLENKGEDVV